MALEAGGIIPREKVRPPFHLHPPAAHFLDYYPVEGKYNPLGADRPVGPKGDPQRSHRMKNFLFFLFLGLAASTGAQESSVSTETPATTSSAMPVTVIEKWNVSKVPWGDWFKGNAMVTDKTDYVHFFWNAQDFKVNFEVRDKKVRLAEAALELVERLYPAGAKADPVKVDIVYVLERDAYGLPKWDSLQQVAHFEFLKSKDLKSTPEKLGPTDTMMNKIFNKFEFY